MVRLEGDFSWYRSNCNLLEESSGKFGGKVPYLKSCSFQSILTGLPIKSGGLGIDILFTADYSIGSGGTGFEVHCNGSGAASEGPRPL